MISGALEGLACSPVLADIDLFTLGLFSGVCALHCFNFKYYRREFIIRNLHI